MRTLQHISLLLIAGTCLLACSHNNKTSNSDTFEKLLGTVESIHLNEMVTDFDSLLLLAYPEQDFRFKKYLEDISKSKIQSPIVLNLDKYTKYNESLLLGLYDTIYPDTVWYDGSWWFNSKYPDEEIIEEMAFGNYPKNEFQIDSTLLALQKEPRYRVIEPNRFYLALESIQSIDSLIVDYIEFKYTVGNISTYTLANGILHSLRKENEYFAKRIFIMETNFN